MRPPPPATVGDAVRRAVAAGELGLQVCAVVDGELVVDEAAGIADPVSRAPVTPDSLFPVFSVTKGVVAAAALTAVAAGDVLPDEPLGAVWAGMGRSGATLRQVLTHTAGLPYLPAGTDVEAMCDWDAMVAAMEAALPQWAPGSMVGYHAYTYGWLVGETLRRAAGRPGEDAGAVVRRLACAPAGTDDFWLGLPDAQHQRVVTVQRDVPCPGDPRPAGERPLLRRAIPAALDTVQAVYGRADVRRAVLPGAGGIATARALAHIYGRLAGLVADAEAAARQGDDDRLGRQLLAGTQVCEERVDIVLGAPVPRGLGFWVSGSRLTAQGPPLGGRPGRFGHPGAGGSIAWGDRGLRAGFAITRNRLTATGWNDPAIRRLVRVVTAAVAAAVDVRPTGKSGR